MESHQEIPSKYYGRWLDVVNKEFEEIIEDAVEENQADNHEIDQLMSSGSDKRSLEPTGNPKPAPLSTNLTGNTPSEQQHGGLRQNQNTTRISCEEEDLFSDFLSFDR